MSRAARHSAIAVAVAIATVAGLLALRHALTGDPLAALRSEREDDASGRQVYEGSWYFPRGGPYILGFESPGGNAVLAVDGRRIVAGQGRQTDRVVYQEGAHAVRFEAPPGARLVWHPPGRRGRNELEYVPPSSLSPDPPEDASFSSWAGASPVDGAVAVAIVLVWAALAVFLLRGALRRIDRRVAAWTLVVVVAALAVRLVDLGGAGQTWDEDVNWSAGRNYVTNLLALDFDQASWVWNYEHPPVTKYIAGVGAQLADGYGPARALSALMIAIGCALLVPIGARLASLRVGILAGALAALTPHLIAHGKVVGHEAPTVLLWSAVVWLCLWAHDPPADGRDAGRGRLPARFAVIGVVFGLAVFARFVNVLMAPMIGAILLVRAPAAERWRTVWLGLAIIPLAALVTGVATWPRLWSEPIAHLQESWDRLKGSHGAEPFLGRFTDQPPWYYFAVYLYATAPVGLLVGAAAGVARLGARWRTEGRTALVIAAWLLAPLAVMASPVRQDGVRYVMPCLTALALLAALGFDALATWAARAVPRVSERAARAVVAAVAVLYLAVVCIRIHPYYLDYYGEQVGGPDAVAADHAYEIAWWGEGLSEALDYLAREAPRGARVHKGCVAPVGHLAWLRGDLWETEVHRPEDADFVLVYAPSTTRCPAPAHAELVYEVSAQGAPLARVYRVREGGSEGKRE